MSVLPKYLFYTESHLWLFVDYEGYITVGLTDFAQESLGDLIEVFLPEEGMEIAEGTQVMSVAGERDHFIIYSPISGEVTEVNQDLIASPTLINQEPYDGGWLFKVAPYEAAELEELLSDEEYAVLIGY